MIATTRARLLWFFLMLDLLLIALAVAYAHKRPVKPVCCDLPPTDYNCAICAGDSQAAKNWNDN